MFHSHLTHEQDSDSLPVILTKLTLWLYRDVMACNNWPDTLYSQSTLQRDPVECFLQVHKALIDWLGTLPCTLKNTPIVGAHPPVPLLKQGKNLKKRKTPADHPVTLRRVGILNCHLAYKHKQQSGSVPDPKFQGSNHLLQSRKPQLAGSEPGDYSYPCPPPLTEGNFRVAQSHTQ